MSFLESISPYVPELLGLLCFILGYFTLHFFTSEPAEEMLIENYPALIKKFIEDEDLESAEHYFREYIVNQIPDIKIINILLKSFCEFKHAERATQLFEIMKASAHSNLMTIETYDIIASAFIEIWKPTKALEIIKDLPKHLLVVSENLEDKIIESFIKQNNFQEAINIFKASENKTRLLPRILKSAIKLVSNENTISIYQQLKTAGSVSTDLCEVVEYACKAECIEVAQVIFSDIKFPLASCSCSMINLYVKLSCVEPAIRILRDSIKLRITIEDASIVSIIELCGRLKKFELIVDVLPEVRLAGSEISLDIYNCFIDTAVRTQFSALAWSTFEDMKIMRCPPDNFTYSVLIKALKNDGESIDSKKITQILDSLTANASFQPDEIIFNCLLDACISVKRVEIALEVFNKMPKHDEISYNTLIKGFSQTKQHKQAIEILEKMKTSCVKPNEVTYNSIIDTCVRCNQISLAWDYLEEMQQFGIKPDNFTYSTLVKGIKGENSADDLQKTFKILESGQISPDEVLYNCLIDACARVGDINKCIEVFIKMQHSGIEASSVTYGIMIKAYGQANMLQKALKTFEEMSDRGLKANDVTYGCLLDACVKSGDMVMAQSLFSSMQTDGIILNTILYTTMIKGYSKTQNLVKALSLFEEMKAKVQPNNVTYNSLLDCAVRCEDMATANSLFLEMQELMEPDLISYSTMIKGLCRSGDVAAALQVMNNMKTRQISPDEVLFNSLLDGCAKLGVLDIAEQVYSDMKSLKIKPSNVTYSILIKLYGKNKEINRALDVLEDMKRENVQPGMIVYTCLLQACIRCKNIHKALQLYSDMTKSGVRGDRVTFNTLVNGCVYAKQLDSAYKITKDSLAMNVKLAEDVYNNLLRNLIASRHSSKSQWATEISEKMKEMGIQPETAWKTCNAENSYTANSKSHFAKKTPMGERHFNINKN